MNNATPANDDLGANRVSEENIANDHGCNFDSQKGSKDDSSESIIPMPTHVDQSSAAKDEEAAQDDSDAESIGGQRNTMSSKRLMVAIPALSVCLFVSFVDQTSVSTATPAIAGDLALHSS